MIIWCVGFKVDIVQIYIVLDSSFGSFIAIYGYKAMLFNYMLSMTRIH